jgi:hypothetical protein
MAAVAKRTAFSARAADLAAQTQRTPRRSRGCLHRAPRMALGGTLVVQGIADWQQAPRQPPKRTSPRTRGSRVKGWRERGRRRRGPGTAVAAGGSPPHPVAGVRWWCSLVRLWVIRISRHSVLTADLPRR